MRTLLAAATGALAFAAVVAAGLLASRAATERLRQGASAEMAQAARHIADTLDRGMFERWRDVQIAAAHPALRDPAAPPEAKREALRLLERTYPDYAISALVGTDGRVEVTSRGILEGADVSGRAYFLHGRAGPYAGDVHEALLMTTHLAPRPDGEPVRFVDLAAPVADPDGRPAGVLAVHLYWDWAEGVERDVLQPLRERSPGTDALVLARDGTVLLGPAGLRGAKLAVASAEAAGAGRAGALREHWVEMAAADGSEDLVVGHAPTRGHRGYPGLGWSVLVRQDAASAFAAAEALRREILLWAGAVALAAATAAWLLANAATRPVRMLTAIADRLAQEPGSASGAQQAAARLGTKCLYREGAALGAAMAGMIGSQRRAAVVLAAEEARLRAVLERMPVGVVLADAPTGRVLMRNRRAEEIAGGGGALFDPRKGRALTAEEYPLARAARDGRAVEGEIFQLQRENGAEAWLEVSAARLADPAGGLLAIATVSDISGRKAAERERELLIRELNHRVKNMLATVQALAAQTMGERAAATTGAADFVQAFGQRLRALARAHDLIAAGAWEEAELAAVARAALAPLLGAAGSERIHLNGRAAGLRIGPREAQALALALHELATNALKHGSLSVPGGKVFLDWDAPARPGERVALEWVEIGGPPVLGPPARRGFGTRLLQRGLARDLGAGAEVELEFNRAGLRAAIRFARLRSVGALKEAAAPL